MTDGTKRAAVLDALPAPADSLKAELGMTHEDVYTALVALESRGMARCVPVYACPRRRFTWEPA